jgi:hypothetical protein
VAVDDHEYGLVDRGSCYSVAATSDLKERLGHRVGPSRSHRRERGGILPAKDGGAVSDPFPEPPWAARGHVRWGGPPAPAERLGLRRVG